MSGNIRVDQLPSQINALLGAIPEDCVLDKQQQSVASGVARNITNALKSGQVDPERAGVWCSRIAQLLTRCGRRRVSADLCLSVLNAITSATALPSKWAEPVASALYDFAKEAALRSIGLKVTAADQVKWRATGQDALKIRQLVLKVDKL